MINLYLIRHGEAIHNVLFKQHGMKTFFDQNYYDTKLTELGYNQAIRLGETWEEIDKIDLVIVSSLTRALQTAQNIFKDKNIKIISLDFLKEYPQGKHTCNKRDSKNNIENMFPNIDFSKLDSVNDEMWDPHNIESIDSLLSRINKMYDFIETTNCKNIAIVGHNSFISMMKYGKFLRIEDGEEELKHCYPYEMEIKFD